MSTPNPTPNGSTTTPIDALNEYFATIGQGYRARAEARWEERNAIWEEKRKREGGYRIPSNCPCCGGPYNHSEAACQGDYLGNFEPEFWDEAMQEWEDLDQKDTCAEPPAGVDC